MMSSSLNFTKYASADSIFERTVPIRPLSTGKVTCASIRTKSPFFKSGHVAKTRGQEVDVGGVTAGEDGGRRSSEASRYDSDAPFENPNDIFLSHPYFVIAFRVNSRIYTKYSNIRLQQTRGFNSLREGSEVHPLQLSGSRTLSPGQYLSLLPLAKRLQGRRSFLPPQKSGRQARPILKQGRWL